MASLVEAVSSGKRFKHDRLYDGTWIFFKNDDSHMMLTRKFILSTDYTIEGEDQMGADPVDAKPKKVTKLRKKNKKAQTDTED